MKTNKLFLLLLAVILVVVSACQGPDDAGWEDYNFSLGLDDYEPGTGNDSVVDLNDTKDSDGNVSVDTDSGTENLEIDEGKASLTIEATEGDLVKIPVSAVDPDGDFIEYEFEAPFNNKGLWQTEIGDEGKYLVEVAISDGKLSTSDFILVVINRANRAPTIECPKKIRVEETELVKLDCNIYDVDGDVVIVGYDGWMKTATYQTNYEDAGTYSVLVRAKDKNHESTEEIEVIVENKNRAPVIEDIALQSVMEEDDIQVLVDVSDADGDDVEVEFGNPLNKDGSWTPTYGDRGMYNVSVVADDGKDKSVSTFELEVLRLNRAPVIKPLNDIEVDEGDSVVLPIQTYDPDGDEVVITYAGWMDSDEYSVSYDDAHPDGCNFKGCTAEYEVVVMVSDGVLSSEETVTIRVKDVNRPPVFVFDNP
ncbi:hypothetical protein K9L97_04340 [Candidatus Woesearchaeota archaeon]|nr:hypothetical protein [Candidatus Woesearchaeota archaeon]